MICATLRSISLHNRPLLPVRYVPSKMSTMAAATRPQDLFRAGGVERFDDAIKADHDGIRGLFGRFFDDSADLQERQRTGWQIIRDLAIHSLAEEEMIYPDMTNKLGKEARDHALHEHTVMKKVLVELDGMNLGHSDGSLNTKYVDLMRNLKKEFDHHTTEEEEKWVPELVQALDGETVQKLSERFSATKTHEPTRPHSWAPDKPITGNIVGNKLTAPLDHLRDVARWGTGPIPSTVIRPGNGQTA